MTRRDLEDMPGEQGGTQSSQIVWFHFHDMGQHRRISGDRKQISDCQGLAGRKEMGTHEYKVSFWGDGRVLDVDGSGGRTTL